MNLFNETYVKNYGDVHWSIVHLYEHVVLSMLRDEMVEKFSLTEAAVGFEGRTYEKSFVEINCLFLSPVSRDYFDDFINNLPQASDEQILANIEEIESEEGLKYTHELDDVKAAFSSISKLRWQKLSSVETMNYSSLAGDDRQQNGAKLARKKVNLALAVPFSAKNNLEKYVIAPFVLDIVLCMSLLRLGREFGLHTNGETYESYRNNINLGTYVIFKTTRTDISRQSIIQNVNKIVKKFGSEEELEKLAELLPVLYRYSSLQGRFATADVFENTRLLVGLQGIEKLSTPDNIHDILNNLNILVSIK